MMGLGPYRNVEIRGELVIGEQFVDPPVNDWIKFRGSERLMKIHHAVLAAPGPLFQEIWELSDGMGQPPPREYDWSAIRDSTMMSTLAMLEVAERWWETHNPGAKWPWQLPEVQKA